MQCGVAVTTRQLCVDSTRTALGDGDDENSPSGRSRWKESNVLHQLGKLVVQVVAADVKEDARSNATPSRPAIAISGG